MKNKFTFAALLLGTIAVQAQLFVDFGATGQPLEPGYQAYNAVNTTPASFTTQPFPAFGTTIGVGLSWDIAALASSMRVVNRTQTLTDGVNLLRDWIGTDNRSAASPSGIDTLTITLTNLPAGTYRWLSYHHDAGNQTGPFDAAVLDVKGARTNLNIDTTDGNLPLASVGKWITTITSDGVNPVRLRFRGLGTADPNSFFLINGFDLSFLGTASEWTNTTGGNWSASANWDSGVPNGPANLAILGNSILTPSTVTVNTPVTLAGISLTSAQSYTLSGANSITLGATASIAVDLGSHTIAVPLAVSGGGGLNLAGAGSLTLSGANSYTGPTVANLSPLTITSMANGGSPSALGASASDAANLIFNGTLRYIGSGHTSDRLFTLPAGTRTVDASGTGALNLSNPGNLALSGTGARTLVLTGTNTGNNTLSATLTDATAFTAATSLTKNGPGKWVLAGANTQTGNVTVNEGTLAVAAGGALGMPVTITVQSNAVLDVSAAGGLVLSQGPVLQGSGSVVGDVSDGTSVTVIRPGGAGVAGTLTFSNALTLAAGGTIEMDLTSSTAAGGGTNDLIEVNGNLDLSSVVIRVNFTGASLGTPYRLINYKGALVGTPSVTVAGLDETRYTATVTAAGGQVNLVVSGAPVSLTWLGDGSANLWNVMSSVNWSNPATGQDVFRHLDNVLFSNAGGASSNVNLDAVLRPGSVTVNASVDYSLIGTGRLSGGMSLVKTGTGSLTLSNANDFTGTTTVSGGILRLGNNTALGTSAGGTVIQSGATLDVYGFQTSSDRITVTGSGVGGRGAIINTRAEQQSATRMVTLTGDTYVTSDFRWDVRGAGGNSSFSGLFDLGGFNFTKGGSNRIAIVDAFATNAGNIVILQGGMSLTRSYIEGPGYIDVGTNFVWIENSATGRISKPMIFANGRLQCSGGDFILHSFITNSSGLTLDAGGVLILTNPIAGAGWLNKTGTSVARLEAANTYAGDTTISAGTLALGTNGTIGGGATLALLAGATFDVTAQGGLTVAAGKTLIGGGTINGGLTVANNGTLQVGSVTNTGVLIVTNGNTLLGGVTLMKVNAATKAADSISTSNAITYGGALTVASLGGTFAHGDTFKLFNAPVRNGSFSIVTLPELPAGYLWIDRLAVDGTIAVGALRFQVAQLPGGFWQFSWDPILNNLVKLQAQTNTLDVGLSTNWGDYPGGTVNGVIHVPNTGNPSVFFRLMTQ